MLNVSKIEICPTPPDRQKLDKRGRIKIAHAHVTLDNAIVIKWFSVLERPATPGGAPQVQLIESPRIGRTWGLKFLDMDLKAQIKFAIRETLDNYKRLTENIL